ncbi:iron-sulfur cluster assembly accessory protein [bacterium]|jgi:iron-sulfur cluster assembly accessory protein|nr:iron-sulfur cluster assembly accessory protein [bacterium]MDB4128574.1 iron-sulfur cluster assembly accessory protein [bacterium]
MIKITEEAEHHLKGIQDANEGKFPRLGVTGGGCAGFKYDWQLVAEGEIDDMVDEVIPLGNGGTLVLDGMSVMFLFGTELQLSKTLFGTTLEIVNPQAQAGCGCGESVNFDMDLVEANMANPGGFKLPE